MDKLIEIKAGAPLAALASSGMLAFWRERQSQFLERARSAVFGALILDYDGTVYAGGQRNNAWPDGEMAELLGNLLDAGLRLGFASGRGVSLRDALRHTFPRQYWPQIYAAYQDGAEIGRLDDDTLPTPYMPGLEAMALAQTRMKLGEIFRAWPETVEMRPENSLLGIYGAVESGEKIFRACCGVAVPLGLKVFHGGRMTDIAVMKASKRNLVKYLGRYGELLALGDAGAWPGNDCELLALPTGVSVGSMSPDPSSCWRITDAEGIEATKEILRALKPKAAAKARLEWPVAAKA